jgi:GntR family transcriptional regulator
MTNSKRLPRSVQISEALIREISSGVLMDGARLPTEKQMAAQYDVAVGTLRKSLAILESKGLLERIQGSGNYIRVKQEVESVYKFFRLELLEGGGLPTAKILSIAPTIKKPGFPNFGDSNIAYKIIRLRYLDETLIALEQIWLDRRFTNEMRITDVSESLYNYYRTALNLVISRMEDKISFQAVPDWAPEEFNLSSGTMAGYIERIGWDQFDQPAEFSKTWFNPDVCNYVNRT